MQLSFKRKSSTTGRYAAGGPRKARAPKTGGKTLLELERGEEGILDRIDLPEDIARRLMELGFLPGHVITRGRSAPGGDPRVFRVDGSEIALRRETAAKLFLRPADSLLESPGRCASPAQ